MNFKINRDILYDNLINIKKGLSNKPNNPIQKGIKIEAVNGELILTSSSQSIAVKTIITEKLNIIEPGKVLIPGRFFIEIISKVIDHEIEIINLEGNTIKINAGKSSFTLNGMDYLDYPQIEFKKIENPIVLTTPDFRNLIKQTTFSASTSENRPILTGLNVRIKANKMICVATDSYRLSQKIMEIPQDIEKAFVIPAKAVEEFSKVLENANMPVIMHVDDKEVLFEYANTLFKSRLLEGNYPETSRLIPEEFPVIIKFNKDELITAVEHASLLSTSEASNNIVKLSLRADLVVEITSSNSEVGKVLEVVNPIDKVKGSQLQVAFSSKYILDALKQLNSSTVSVNFTGEIRPFTITGPQDADVIQLILPVRTE